jgi:hypothetical protein
MLNKWTEDKMKKALEMFHKQDSGMKDGTWTEEIWSRRAIAQHFEIPPATFNNRCTGKIEGFKHKSGGKREPKVFTPGKNIH